MPAPESDATNAELIQTWIAIPWSARRSRLYVCVAPGLRRRHVRRGLTLRLPFLSACGGSASRRGAKPPMDLELEVQCSARSQTLWCGGMYNLHGTLALTDWQWQAVDSKIPQFLEFKYL